MIGRKLSHFEITAKLGAGGMGEVYRARDTRLDRDVALKVLPEAFTSDPERLARFEREAKVLASLNHPGIGHLYGLEEAGGVQALIMELVEGPTLADRIALGPIPPDEALPIARQIAEALEAAHERGIVHRDLKPANVKITPEGWVKVLDFGLAKALEPEAGAGEVDLSQSPTLTSPATRLGVILGTAAYMAPEQAEGKTVDARADLFAFGSVLYEMLTGRRAFGGDSVADTLSRVLRAEPPPARERVALPARLDWVLEKCLAKSPADRYQGAGDLAVDLRRARAALADEPEPASSVGPRRSSWAVPAGAALVAAIALVVGALLGRALVRAPEAPTRRFELLTADPQPIASGGGRMVAISRDGMRITYVDRGQLFVRDLAREEAVPVPRSDLGISPFFSPDGDWLAYTNGVGGRLRKVWLASGEAFELCPESGLYGGSWGDDDAIAFSDGRVLRIVRADGTGCRPLGEERREATHAYLSPQFLPETQDLLVELVDSGGGTGRPTRSAAIVSAVTGELVDIVIRDASTPRYLASGHLVFRRGRTVLAQPFEPRTRKTRGKPIPVVGDVAFAALTHLDASPEGTLVYVPARAEPELELVWVGRDGRENVVVNWFSELRELAGGT